MNDNKYSIGSGSIGDDNFDPVDDQNNMSAPSLPSDLSVPGSTPSIFEPIIPEGDDSISIPQNQSIFQPASDQEAPNFLNSSPSGAPSFLGGESNAGLNNNLKPKPVQEEISQYPAENLEVQDTNQNQSAYAYPDNSENQNTQENSTFNADFQTSSYGYSSDPIPQSIDLPKSDYNYNVPKTENSYSPAPEKQENYEMNNAYNYSQPPQNNYSEGSPSAWSNTQANSYAPQRLPNPGLKIALRFLLIALFLAVGLGGTLGVYYFYKPSYEDRKFLEAIREDFASLEEGVEGYSDNVSEFNSFIEDNLGDGENEKDTFTTESAVFWSDMSERAEEYLAVSEPLKEELTGFSEIYVDENLISNQESTLLNSYIDANSEYLEVHILIGERMSELNIRLQELDQDVDSENKAAAAAKITALKSFIEESNVQFRNKLFETVVLESFDLLSYYFDYSEYIESELNKLQNNIDQSNFQRAKEIMDNLEEGFETQDRIQAERFFYSTLLSSAAYIQKEEIFAEVNSKINNSERGNMPDTIFNIFKTIDSSIGLP
jgi:hypothetical protein